MNILIVEDQKDKRHNIKKAIQKIQEQLEKIENNQKEM